mmetsp:Transcript_3302/g.7763  ORF Transcript_3302/g.7763 Transcript_3302/m.7763 type:complete len:112 (+) Transcript_3302:1273-1608(+)
MPTHQQPHRATAGQVSQVVRFLSHLTHQLDHLRILTQNQVTSIGAGPLLSVQVTFLMVFVPAITLSKRTTDFCRQDGSTLYIFSWISLWSSLVWYQIKFSFREKWNSHLVK